jgi:hypothetical protein
LRPKTIAFTRAATAAHGVNRRTRFARLFVLFALCLSTGWGLDASSTAAAFSCSTPNFSPPTIYGITSFTRSIATDDFDGDGNADVIGVNSSDPGILSLFLGDGTGAFPLRGGFSDPKGRSPKGIATGDFDSDGQPDIVIANGISTHGNASVYLNNGLIFDREIPLRWTNQSLSANTEAVAVADFNADGKLDVVATITSFDAVGVALGDGAGNFSNFKTFNSGGSFPVKVVTSDFNGDGKVDLAVTNLTSGGDNVSILLGDGTGNFGTPTSYAAGLMPASVATGDFNSDNKIDLAVVTSNNGVQSVSILFGDGAGAFSAPSNVALTGTTPGNLGVADFNDDGKSDIAIGRPQSNDVAILLGNGAGNFNLFTVPVAESTQTPGILLTPDLNHDGKPDLVGIAGFGGSAISVMLNGCGATTASLGFNAQIYSVSETTSTATVTVIRSGSLAGSVSVNYTTSDNSAVSPSDYTATSGTLTFADGEASKTFSIPIVNDTQDESQQSFIVTLSNPSGTAVLGGLSIARVNINDEDPTLAFTVNNATVTEGEARATVTVTRTSDASNAAYLEYRTADTDSFTVSCADASGAAFARCDFATTIGRLDFAAGQTQQTFTIPIIDDGHVEGAEGFGVILTNPERINSSSMGALVTINDNDTAGARNPIITLSPADYPFFVRQQYLDFLSREPEPSEPWTAVMNRCPNVNTPPATVTDCDRIAVSGAFFRSPENSIKGFYVFRFYKVAFARLPEYGEIVADMSFVAGSTEAEVYARKAQLAQAFVERSEFFDTYGDMSNQNYVSALLGRYQLTSVTTPDPAAPDGTTKVMLSAAALTSGLNAGTLTRAQVLRAIADSDEVAVAEFNSAFVASQYYGYLRRTPEESGYQAWLKVINEDPNNVRIMIHGFLNSTEYRLRFGQP